MPGNFLRSLSHLFFWQSINFADILPNQQWDVINLLGTTYGRHVRQLQLTIALLEIEGGESNLPTALSVEMASRLLKSVPSLQWLEIKFLSLNNTYYVSSLPNILADALAGHKQIKHFGISCQGETNNLIFQLDEKLAADIVTGFPRLESLTLHRINHDILLPNYSPLLNSVANLRFLRKLSIIEVQAVSELWALRPLGHNLNNLSLVCCPRISSASLDDILGQHRSSLSSLSLVNTPPRDQAHHNLPSHSKAKYELVALQFLHIEGDNSYIDSIAYLERFSQTSVTHLSLGNAPGITIKQIEDYLIRRQLARLMKVELCLFGTTPHNDHPDWQNLVSKAERMGVEVTNTAGSNSVPVHG